MAMSPKCIQTVTDAAGKPLSEKKLAAIESALDAHARELARRDPARWRALTRDQRMQEAAAAAMKEVQAEAALKEHRAALQVLRTAEVEQQILAQMTLNDLTRSQGLIRHIEQTSQYVDAVRNDAISGMGDMLDAASAK